MKVDCLTGSFFMGKLDTFIQLEYFDERTFLFEEERILAQKVKKAGLQNYLALSLAFHHEDSSVINKEIDKALDNMSLMKDDVFTLRALHTAINTAVRDDKESDLVYFLNRAKQFIKKYGSGKVKKYMVAVK